MATYGRFLKIWGSDLILLVEGYSTGVFDCEKFYCGAKIEVQHHDRALEGQKSVKLQIFQKLEVYS